MVLLDDVVLRQVLAARDRGDIEILLRLNLAYTAAGWRHRRLIGAPAIPVPLPTRRTTPARHARDGAAAA